MAPSASDALYFDVHHDGVFVLNPLRDTDVAVMYDFVDSYGKLNMFMSHIHQNLAEFYFQNLNMEESEDEATSRLRIHEIMVKEASNMSYDELMSWAEEETEMQTTKKKVVTPEKKVEHVVDDVDIPLMNLVESPKLKRKLLVINSPSPIAKRKLMGKVTSPTSYVVNKGRSVLNKGNTVNKTMEKGKSTTVKEANTVKKALDKGKGKMVEEERHVHRNMRRNNGIVIEDNVNPTVESDTDSVSDPAKGINYSLYSGSDSDSEYFDKSVDYLSEGEDELMELRKRKTEVKNAPKVRKQQTQAANKGTSSGVQQMKQYFVGDNETIIEHEGFMANLLRKLSQDNGNGMTNQFHIVETKVGDLFVDIEQLKGCLTYYALTNGYSLWFYRSSKTKLIAKCGLRPEKIKDPKLGKQSKFKRDAYWSPRVTLGRLLSHARGLVFKPRRGGFPSGAKKEWGLSPKANVRVLHTAQLDVTGLIEAVKEVMPYAEHRQCARHIYEGMVEDYVPDCYRKQAFYDTYHQYLTPVEEMTFWHDCSDMSRVLPPKPRTMPCRPRKKRIRVAHENKNPNKVSKAGVTMTYTNCHKKGHNKKGCKNASVVLPPKPPVKKGRPRKTPLVGSSLIDEEIETPDVDEQVGVEEQASQYDVGMGGSSQFDVGGSSQFDVGGEKQVTQFDMGGSSDVSGTKKNVVGGSAQFGVQRANDSFSAYAFSLTQYSQNHQVSKQEPQATKQEPQAAEQEPHRSRPRGILNFIRPRPRSERILKKQLAKKVHGIGLTSSNALNLE
nr:pentatricopeptide repeat-containing protein [Tanacetum cinerariifolium]